MAVYHIPTFLHNLPPQPLEPRQPATLCHSNLTSQPHLSWTKQTGWRRAAGHKDSQSAQELSGDQSHGLAPESEQNKPGSHVCPFDLGNTGRLQQ